METSWTIKPGVTWHDGTPFTTDDLLFTLQVGRDREIPVAGDPVYAFVDRVEAVDTRTITVGWNRPYIRADRLFGRTIALPLPAHILRKPYEESKATFADLPYWSSEFVGSGPFKVKEFAPSTGLTLTAFDGYVLGRPLLDQIEVRFILDLNTMVANVLGGSVDMTMGRGISTQQAVQVQDTWRDGKVDVSPRSWVFMFGQYIDPTPAVVADVRFHRAAMFGTNRQEMVDTIQYGRSIVADSVLNPDLPQYRDIVARIPKYPYDPARATALLSELGYTRGGDGLLRDSAGQSLDVEIRTTADVDATVKSVAAVSDYLRRLGMTMNEVVIPTQRAGDRPYRATTPGLEILRGPTGEDTFAALVSARTPLPENNYLVTGNYPRYVNEQWDALINRFFSTIPMDQRMQALSDLVYWEQDQLPIMGLFFDTQVTLIANKLVNVRGASGVNSTQGWDSHTWDMK
jgi:peptide/nickel transport system substrate-binding protein